MTALAGEFQEKGYVFLKKIFSSEEVNHYLQIIESMPQLDKSRDYQAYAIPDGITKLEDFWPIIFHEKLSHSIREILGTEARYVQHSDVHHNLTQQHNLRFNGDYRTLTGWHRDTRFRGGNLKKKEPLKSLEKYLPTYKHEFFSKVVRELFGKDKPVFDETQDPFRIVRAAIYLNSCDEHNAPLLVYPHSTDACYTPNAIERKLYHLKNTFVSKFINRTVVVNRPHVRSKPYLSFPGKPESIWHEPGDVLLFDPRILHTVPTRIATRSNLFLSYGLENSHTFDHVQYIVNERKDMGYRAIEPRLITMLKEHNLYLKGVEEFTGGPLTSLS